MSIYSGFVYEQCLGTQRGGADCDCETRAQRVTRPAGTVGGLKPVNPSKRLVDDSAPVFLMEGWLALSYISRYSRVFSRSENQSMIECTCTQYTYT